MNAYLDLLTSAILTAKSNIADEALPTYSLALKQKRERVIGDPPALTRQSQKRRTLVDCFPDTPSFPIIDFHHGGDHCIGRGQTDTPLPCPLLGEGGEWGGFFSLPVPLAVMELSAMMRKRLPWVLMWAAFVLIIGWGFWEYLR
jgi:hypothetical protein